MTTIIHKLKFIIIFTCTLGAAQPGFYPIRGNLNDISDKEIILSQEENSHYEIIGIEITSDTDLSRLHLLKNSSKLNLSFKIDEIPREFYDVKFEKLNILEIDCNGITSDLENIVGFANAGQIQLKNYLGKSIPNTFKELNPYSLSIINAPNLNNIDVIGFMKLHQLKLSNCPKIKRLPNSFEDNEQLAVLRLEELSKRFDFSSICVFNNLSHLSTYKIDFESIPSCISKNLKQIRITSNSDLESLSNLNNYDRINTIEISKSHQLVTFDLCLANKEILRIRLSDNLKLSNVQDLFCASDIDYVELDKLPNLTILNLEHAKINELRIIKTGLSKIHNIEKLNSIDRLLIKKNRSLKIQKRIKSYNLWIIDENGNAKQ